MKSNYCKVISTVTVLALLMLAGLRQAKAEPILRFSFTGTVSVANNIDGSGSGLGSLIVSAGDPVSGSFSYDALTSDGDSDPKRGEYHQTLVGGISILIGGSIIEISNYYVIVTNDHSIPPWGEYDIFELQPFSNVTLDGSPTECVQGEFDFVQAPGDTFHDDSLPDPSLVINYPGQKYGHLLGCPNVLRQLFFDIETITLTVSFEVDIDIKPSSCPNPLNTKSKGVLPVAILGTPDFDVSQIDVSTVLLEGVAPISYDFEDVATPYNGVSNDDCLDCTEEGPDGCMDLTLKFDMQEVVAALGDVNDGDCILLTITGESSDGTPFEGMDYIVVRSKGGVGPNEKPDECYGCVPKTGQISSYATGDDGDLQMGVAWLGPRFTDNGDGTVTDNFTGLIWLKNANCFGVETWADALNDCNNLADGSCGLTDGSSAGDWRLPNVRELLSLIDFSQYNPALPAGHPLVNLQYDSYWSSTTLAENTDRAWRLCMHCGHVSSDWKDDHHYVSPVRGGR